MFEIDNQMDAMQATIVKLKERLTELELSNNKEVNVNNKNNGDENKMET